MAHLFWFYTLHFYTLHFVKWLITLAKWLITLVKRLITPAKWLITPSKWLITPSKWLITPDKGLIALAKCLIIYYDIGYSWPLLFLFCLRRFIHPSIKEKITKENSPAMIPSVILPVAGINRIVRKAGMVS